MRPGVRVVTSLAGLALLAELGCVALGLRPADYHPKIDPASFKTTVDNPYYPLVPGTTYKYVEKALGEASENEITVTHETKTIMGVPCLTVRDVVRRRGVVSEATEETSAGGAVSTQGSWEAGVGGAEPGILMPAIPTPDEPYRQEYSFGVAEDMAQIKALGESVTVPAGSFSDCVRTEEWSLLEPGSEKRWYAKGIGFVRSESTAGEVATLVSITAD